MDYIVIKTWLVDYTHWYHIHLHESLELEHNYARLKKDLPPKRKSCISLLFAQRSEARSIYGDLIHKLVNNLQMCFFKWEKDYHPVDGYLIFRQTQMN